MQRFLERKKFFVELDMEPNCKNYIEEDQNPKSIIQQYIKKAMVVNFTSQNDTLTLMFAFIKEAI